MKDEQAIYRVTVFTNKKEVIKNVTLINPIADTMILVLVLLNGSSVVYPFRNIIKYIIEKQ
jgi:hypothetical protein